MDSIVGEIMARNLHKDGKSAGNQPRGTKEYLKVAILDELRRAVADAALLKPVSAHLHVAKFLMALHGCSLAFLDEVDQQDLKFARKPEEQTEERLFIMPEDADVARADSKRAAEAQEYVKKLLLADLQDGLTEMALFRPMYPRLWLARFLLDRGGVDIAIIEKSPYMERALESDPAGVYEPNTVIRQAQNKLQGALTGGKMAVIVGGGGKDKRRQSRRIAARYGLVIFSAASLLRKVFRGPTRLARRVRAFMEADQLVPIEIIMPLIVARINKEDAQEYGWLMYGFPRTNDQAEAMVNAGVYPTHVIMLDVPDDMVMEAVLGRRPKERAVIKPGDDDEENKHDDAAPGDQDKQDQAQKKKKEKKQNVLHKIQMPGQEGMSKADRAKLMSMRVQVSAYDNEAGMLEEYFEDVLYRMPRTASSKRAFRMVCDQLDPVRQKQRQEMNIQQDE